MPTNHEPIVQSPKRRSRDGFERKAIGKPVTGFTFLSDIYKQISHTERKYEVFMRTLPTRSEPLPSGQATKSNGRMPRHQEPKKDAESCEKPRGDAYNPRSVGIRMGKPVSANR